MMTNRIKGLDGLRGIAVICVIISHSVLWPYIGIESAKIKSLMNGHIGVSIFFVLSGFLITTLLIQEKESTGRVDIVAFIKRRAMRIFPLYYLYSS
ncbi:acyltransferase [Pseudomonas putida]|uniref:Acyltransferase n=2 Tax=Pseudomonas putida TaxID=303 RepID=A0A4D6XIZ5_PSEPU|nr:acyltransferase [Pseudomonas putida]